MVEVTWALGAASGLRYVTYKVKRKSGVSAGTEFPVVLGFPHAARDMTMCRDDVLNSNRHWPAPYATCTARGFAI
jgi:hypothetical protein